MLVLCIAQSPIIGLLNMINDNYSDMFALLLWRSWVILSVRMNFRLKAGANKRSDCRLKHCKRYFVYEVYSSGIYGFKIKNCPADGGNCSKWINGRCARVKTMTLIANNEKRYLKKKLVSFLTKCLSENYDLLKCKKTSDRHRNGY